MSAHVPGKSQATEPAPPSLVFPCSSCRKSLRTKAVLAGKSVRCPHCGHVMVAPRNQPTSAPEAPVWRALLPPLLLALILWATFGLKLQNLDHSALTRWDEAHHAVVAQNVMKHPFNPTLVDVPYLPYDHRKWGENHVWLHKPILPFWQTAISLAILGVNAFALRLPAAILSTGAACLTYLIGKELFDRRIGLVAAALQAANPFVVTLVHGYQFADNIDIALLFWVEVGVYFLARAVRSGSWRDVLLAGLAQGLAFLCKSYLAGIILGIALAAWLLPVCRLVRREDCRLGPARVLALLGVSIMTVAPWLGYCAMTYPEEFWHEQAQIWRHLGYNVENWAAPWDRVVFDYLIAMYGVFYTPALVAVIALVGKTVRQRHIGLWLAYAWGIGVIVPHLWAVTKTPSATLIGMPAFLLLLGHLIAEASRGERWPLTALTAILVMSLVLPAVVKDPGHGYPSSRAFGAVMFKSMWVIHQIAWSLAIAVLVSAISLLIRTLGSGEPGALATGGRTPVANASGSPGTHSRGVPGALATGVRIAAQLFCLGVLIWLGYQTVGAAWDVTLRDVNDPYSVEAGAFAREQLPDNAVLLCEERKGYEHLTIMFYADRTCYALNRSNQDVMARQILEAGGIPYLVSRRTLPYPRVHVSNRQGPSVYLWQPNPGKS